MAKELKPNNISKKTERLISTQARLVKSGNKVQTAATVALKTAGTVGVVNGGANILFNPNPIAKGMGVVSLASGMGNLKPGKVGTLTNSAMQKINKDMDASLAKDMKGHSTEEKMEILTSFSDTETRAKETHVLDENARVFGANTEDIKIQAYQDEKQTIREMRLAKLDRMHSVQQTGSNLMDTTQYGG